MKSVLIVDDEPRAIKAMKYVINWETYGYDVPGEALNGRQAIEQLKQHPYSLLITDIRMPGLSGLALISEIRSFSKIPIIVMSGHEDFQYAKDCIKFGVKEYLLKPVASEDLERLLLDIEDDRLEANRLNMKLHLSIPVIRDQIMKQWAHGHLSEVELHEQLGILGISLPANGKFNALVIEMDTLYPLDSNCTEREWSYMRFAIRNVIEETIGAHGYVWEEGDDRHIIISCEERDHNDFVGVEERHEQMISNIERYTKVPVNLSVGRTVYRMEELAESYNNAVKLMDRKFWSSEKIVTNDTVSGVEYGEIQSNTSDDIQHIVAAIKQKDNALVRQLLSEQQNVFMANQTPRTIVQSMGLEVLLNLIRIIQDNGGEYKSLFNQESQDYKQIISCKKMEGIFELIGTRCETVIDFLREQRCSSPVRTVMLLKKIVGEKYAEELTLRKIGTQIHINPVYLGQLFKSSEGLSFNDYLMQIRMEKAKDLLLYTDKKVYEIANEIGYKELDWFYRRFKEYTGVSTKEFRGQS